MIFASSNLLMKTNVYFFIESIQDLHLQQQILLLEDRCFLRQLISSIKFTELNQTVLKGVVSKSLIFQEVCLQRDVLATKL